MAGGSATGRTGWRAGLASLMAGVLVGCYAVHYPVEPTPEAEPLARARTPGRGVSVGIVAGPATPDADGVGLDPQEAARALAQALRAGGRFREVIHPYPASDRGAARRADLVLTVEVRCSTDPHLVFNLVRQVAVGASLLLLQPVFPTRRDRVVSLSARASLVPGGEERTYRARAVERLEYTWLQPPREVLAAWARSSVRAAAARLAREVSAGVNARSRGAAPPAATGAER